MKLLLRGFTVLILWALAVFGTGTARADISGSVSGIVTDPSGAVVVGATVIATADSTNIQHSTVTDGRGFFAFPALSVDHYTITLRQTGYAEFVARDIIINANSAVRVDISLRLGRVTNTVSVQEDALHVETQSTQMGEVIDGTKITSMPLNGRSFIDLLALQPGVSPYQGNDSTSGVGASTLSGDQTNGTQSVNGGRVEANGFMVNGADAEEGVHNGAAMIPNVDSIAQFRIITNNFNAEYGNFSGGQVNVVTKSGTNRFNGDVFDFLRNTDLDAKNYFSSQRGVFIQNQFGGTLGGPIKRDKLFFFGDYQGTRQILGQTQFFPVPSLADRAGNLSDEESALEVSDPANGGQGVVGPYWAGVLSQRLGYTVTAGEPYYTAGCTDPSVCAFPNGVIPQSAWSPAATGTLKYIPMPNVSTASGPAFQTAAYNGTLQDNKGGIRIDNTTRYGALFGYYFIDKFTTINPYDQLITIPGFADQNTGKTQMINLGLTTTYSPTLVNDVRLVYLRDTNFTGVPVQGQGAGVSLSSLGFNTPWDATGGLGNIAPQLVGVPSFFFNNYEFGLAQDTLRQYNNTLQVLDNVTKVSGTHTMQFGVDFHYDQINERNFDDPQGAFGFNGSETGLDFADYLIGAVNSFTQASQQLLDSRAGYYGGYLQDSWRATRQLTLNYGLRYEVMTPWYDTQNKLETLIAGEQSQAFPGAPVGMVLPGDPGVPRTLSPIKYTNFAPRIGFAYAPNFDGGMLGKIFGNGDKSSIRAGYGIFYSSIQDATGFVEVGDAPYGLYYSSPVPPLLESPYIDRATGNNEGIKFPFTFPPVGVSPKNPDTTFNWVQATPISGSDYFYPHNKIPYVEEFEFSVQRQLGSATVLTASYVGNVGRHLLTFEESNPANPALCLQLSNSAILAAGSTTCGPFGEDNVYTLANGTNVNGTRPTFGINFGSNPFMMTAVSSSFNSLQVAVEHNEKYANFLLGYTWEKSIDNGSTAFDATNPYNPGLSRSLSILDVPQDLVASYTVQLPFNNLTGNGDISTRVAGGWALSGVTTFASGQPVQLEENDDRSLTGTFNDTVDEPSYADNGSKLYVNKDPRSQQPYFNPNYFTFEPLGQVGNVMRRYFSGPGILNSDMALLKDTKIRENENVEFRAEAFNVFNHAQFNNPSGQIDNTGAGGFGYVTSARDPRIMQVALKFIF
jgi:hypothetical protein